ncbi:MAG: hypothetical protein JWP31_1532 [Aeromicrobium sp.]|nr:hypothetical protein [Aeromicrobium sp.]
MTEPTATAVGVGHALISLVEPHAGEERRYNRWYEDDHFFAGAMHAPGIFAGRRWVATRELQALRLPAQPPPGALPVADPLASGCYLTTYWIAPGQLDAVTSWTSAQNRELVELGRIHTGRTHVFTSFQEHVAAVRSGTDVPPEVFSLMDPAPGLVLEVVDAAMPQDRVRLERWLLEEHLPQRLTAVSASSAMLFRTTPPHPGMKPEVRATLGRVANDGRRLTVLWFLRRDPASLWPEIEDEPALVHAGGCGEVSLLAPFLPSAMGTDRYDDALR